MSSHRSRAYSPPRHYVDQSRATTGNVYVTSFDTAARGGSPSQTRASVSSASSSRPSVEYSAQPMRKSTFADGKTKTEYAIRPRHGSFNPSDLRQPLSVSTRHNSPPRRGPVVMTSPRELAPTVMRDDSARFLQPASSHSHHHSSHQRHNSTSLADSGPREAKERRERSYHSRAPYVQKVYDNRVPTRGPEDEGWSYTNEHEQFDRGLFRRPPGQRELTSRRERPMNQRELERPPVKRDSLQPQSLSRQLIKSDRDDSDPYLRRSGHESDPDRATEVPRRRHSTRPTILHQQVPRDDGYSSARDDYESRGHSKQKQGGYDDDSKSNESRRYASRNDDADREYYRRYPTEPDREKPRRYERNHDRGYERDHERDDRPSEERRRPRSRESSPERSGLKELATTALGGLAAAGVVKGIRDHKNSDDGPPEDDQKERRRRKHRRRSRDEGRTPDGSEEEHSRRRDDRPKARPKDNSSSETPDDPQPRRRHSSRRHGDDEAYVNGKAIPADESANRPPSKVRSRDQNESSPERPSRGQIPAHKEDQDLESLESRTISPGENEDERPRRVQLVEPVKEKETAKPRGILKPARQVPFPEDPNPIREGVAPLKDATKDGIPPNARWTKISRVLVNPEALEKLQERFEERDDYVIVLRVLSREEIKKLADKTKEIRDAREREWEQRYEQERRDNRHRKPNDGESTDSEIDYNREDGRQKPQLAIEQGPPAPPANLHDFQNNQTSQGSIPGQTDAQVPVPIAARPMSSALPVPDINVEGNYSENV